MTMACTYAGHRIFTASKFRQFCLPTVPTDVFPARNDIIIIPEYKGFVNSMPRAKKAKIQSKEVDFSFKLGEREFPVIPFFESEDSYDKGTEFLILATPILMKILSLASASDSPLSQIDPASAISSLDVPSLIKELSHNLPKLVSLSCQMSDSSVDAEAVKKLAKTPLSAGMLKAVIMQMKRDEILKRFAEIKEELSGLTAELGSLA